MALYFCRVLDRKVTHFSDINNLLKNGGKQCLELVAEIGGKKPEMMSELDSVIIR
jgi:hypothetical protein